jgi:hypothetical protein
MQRKDDLVAAEAAYRDGRDALQVAEVAPACLRRIIADVARVAAIQVLALAPRNERARRAAYALIDAYALVYWSVPDESPTPLAYRN